MFYCYASDLMRSGDQPSVRESMLSLEPREILGRLCALETQDLGSDERAGILREITSWERHISGLEPQRP